MTIVITSKHDGFRRCGIAHSRTAKRYPDDFFSETQLRALSKEPQLILAYEEEGFDQVQDRRDENSQEVDVSKAPDSVQNAQPKTPEANATALGDAVVLLTDSVDGSGDAGSNRSGSGPDAPVIEQDKGQLNATVIDLEVLWNQALQENQAREEAKEKAAKPPAKPGKPKAAKE